MLIEFFGENFGCFRDEFRLSMEATDIDPGDERGVRTIPLEDGTTLRLLRSAVIYGANASGKSMVIRAASALRSLIELSAHVPVEYPLLDELYEPFLLDDEPGRAARLGLIAVVAGGSPHRYEVAFDRGDIRLEKLTRLLPSESVLFERRESEVTGSWTDDPKFALIKQDFRPNALLLSLAATLAPQLASLVAGGFARALLAGAFPADRRRLLPPGSAMSASQVARRVKANPTFESWLERYLRRADLGVQRITVHEMQPDGDLYWRQLVARLGNDQTASPKEAPRSLELRLEHSGSTRSLPMPYRSESLGTRNLIERSPLIYDVIHEEPPVTAFVDELDASLHPMLFEAMVRAVNAPANPDVGGQLIFTAHETIIIDGEARDAAMRRDQIYYTTKGSDGVATLFSQVEFKERHNVNLRRRYLQGLYGAIPALQSE